MTSNIILIGMPGAGKSTIGMELADTLNVSWIDTDQIIERKISKKLAEYIEENGVPAFKKLEEEVLLDLDTISTIISTGGSVIYSEAGMKHLQSLGKIIYLDVAYETIESRILQNPQRGIVNASGVNLRKLFDDRTKLYRSYADHTINANNKNIEEITYEIIQLI